MPPADGGPFSPGAPSSGTAALLAGYPMLNGFSPNDRVKAGDRVKTVVE